MISRTELDELKGHLRVSIRNDTIEADLVQVRRL